MAVARKSQLGGSDSLGSSQGIPLNARDLHQSSNRVARQPKVVLHPDLRRVLHLGWSSAHHSGEASRGHRAGHSHLTLAPDFGRTNGGALLVEHSNGGGGCQEHHNVFLILLRHKADIVLEHRGDN